MPTALLVIYMLGLVTTAIFVLQNPVFRQGYLVNAGTIALWPLYWAFYLTSLFTGRTKGPSRRSTK